MARPPLPASGLRPPAPDAGRRRALRGLGWSAAALAVPWHTALGATTQPAPAAAMPPWLPRLSGTTLALLGEVHDNPLHHQQRLAVLQRAVQAGWRPTVAMEQFDRERQADLDRARRERPGDAQHLIDQAAGSPGGWDWALYRPLLAWVLEAGLPLRAANLSMGDTRQVVRGGLAAVFPPDERAALGLDRSVPPAVQAEHEREIDRGHCGALPAKAWPAMARAQQARDAVMAAVVARAAAESPTQGVVLLAGNGHVRRDLGVPLWLAAPWRARAFSVGFIESTERWAAGSFDAVVTTAPAEREDPCLAFRPPAATPTR